VSVALSPGSFDGLHLGHQAVLSALLSLARDASLSAAVVTFEPHPLEVLRSDGAPALLTDRPEKNALLAELGVRRIHVLPFTREFALIEARDYIRDILVGELGCQALVVGEDHRFGRGRAAGADELRELAREFGLLFEIVPRVLVGGEPVSSTRIRQALARGDLTTAADLLGRPYGVLAPVVPGAGRGRDLGAPTINLALSAKKQMPPAGIYACRARVGNRPFAAAVHWGGRPTFGEPTPVLEAHLLDYDGDLYGEWVLLEFVAWIREVERFETIQELSQAIQEDVRRSAQVVEDAAGVDGFTTSPTSINLRV
jgi:riboflavin kinase/FMN adenylyltransferase